MANDKKSFILYTDLITVVEKLIIKDRDNKTNYSGELFYHILQYVNDQDPIPIDFIVEMAFEPIKLQLKRDLKRYENIREKRSEAGKISAKNRQQIPTNSTLVESVQQCSTNPTVTVNDNDTVNGNVTDTVSEIESIKFVSVENEFSSTSKNKKSIEERKQEFKDSIDPYREKYESEMLNEFWRYWTEKNKNGIKMRFEMQKVFDVGRRLATWFKNQNNNFNGTQKSPSGSQARQQRVDEVAEFRRANQKSIAERLQKHIAGNSQ